MPCRHSKAAPHAPGSRAQADERDLPTGAGAVAALAYGSGSVPRVDAIVGPGNRWVTEAKRQVAGEVIIDSPAGPSEVLVLADANADPRLVALEMMAQAEHDPLATALLITPSQRLAQAVQAEVTEITARTVPPDFRRRQPHRCWLLER